MADPTDTHAELQKIIETLKNLESLPSSPAIDAARKELEEKRSALIGSGVIVQGDGNTVRPLTPLHGMQNRFRRVDSKMGWWEPQMKDKRFFRWISMSIIAGFLWGVWQGGFLQGLIYGLMVFIALLAFDWYMSRKSK